MLLTDCYSLKLSGTANSTSAENKTAAASKAVPGAKFGSTFVARTSCFVHPEEQLWPNGLNFLAVSILPPKCRRQWLGWSYCAASPNLGRNKVKTKDKP